MTSKPRTRPPSPETEGPLPWPADDPDLAAFLPMLYVVWADGILTPDEVDAVRGRMEHAYDLTPDARRVLESWLRPHAPPSSVAMAELRDRIRAEAAGTSDEDRRSLAHLGAAIVRRGGEGGGRWASADGLRTLEGVEEALGVLGGEAARALLAGEAGAPRAEAESPPEASFDVPLLRRTLDGEQASIRREVLALLADPEFHVPEGTPTPEHRERTLRAMKRLASRGMGSKSFPEEWGGRDDIAGSIAVFEALAHGDQSLLVKFGVHFGLFGGSVLQLGTAWHHRRFLPEIATLALPGCYAMTEIDHGSNVRALETQALWLPDEDAFEIHTPHPGARKDWIGNAALHGRIATVFAQLEVDGEEHGVHAFLVPIRADDGSVLPGVSIEDCGEKVGLNGVDNGRIGFDRVRVPREHLLDRFASVTTDGRYTSPINAPGRRFFTMLGTLVAGRISIAAAAVSASRTALTIAVRYSARRRQFGPSGRPELPILDYLTQQRLLLPKLAGTFALHFGVRDLISRYAGVDPDDEEERGRIEVRAAGLKALASRHAQETIQAAREACGGQGYLAANRFGTLRDDTDVFTTFEGANVVLLQLVAKGLLSRFRDEMGDLDFRGMVRFLAERASQELTRRNPVRSRRSAEEFLRAEETQLDAFRFREQRLLATVARRLKARIDDGMDSFDATIECQDHLVALARAHTERVVLECFREAVARAPNPPLSEVLNDLSDLWALSTLEADRAWFLEAGYMEPSQTRAIRGVVNRLCGEIRTQAVHLVDAFGIPDAVLRAPAAQPPWEANTSVLPSSPKTSTS